MLVFLAVVRFLPHDVAELGEVADVVGERSYVERCEFSVLLGQRILRLIKFFLDARFEKVVRDAALGIEQNAMTRECVAVLSLGVWRPRP